MQNLNSLERELPGPLAQSDKESQDAFRAAALSLTGLFKVGKKATKSAFLAGKLSALSDVLEFVQSGLDCNGSGNLEIERFINYICSRQETIKLEVEGELEEDELPQTKSNNAPPPQPSPIRPSIPILASSNQLHHRQQPIPSTSSSTPPSPNQFNQSFASNTTLSSPTTILPSSLTRLQLRREKDRKGKSSSSRSSLSNPTIPVTESMIITEGNLKRRWTTGPPNIEIDLESSNEVRIDFGEEVGFGQDEEMEGETKRRKL